ncbi:polyketide cyclase [Vreelandella venusta]|nr:polyketide cyclase [Halomonas hydrothermalis]
MSVSLPPRMATYIAISNGADDAALAECFTADARVQDEGKTHQGIAAIRDWLRGTRRQFEYHVAPTQVTQDGHKMVITTTVTGDFPGSPVQLFHHIELADERIHSLEITP